MIEYLTCPAVADRLDSFVDGELPLPEQVAVESHLRWCRSCADRRADLEVIRGAVRLGAAPWGAGGSIDAECGGLRDGVLARIRAEREQALPSRIRGLLSDRRLLWPVVGASGAVLACVGAATFVLSATAGAEAQPDSMAGMLQLLAHRLALPRVIDAGDVVDAIREDEAVYALAATVTKDGRAEGFALLAPEGVWPASRVRTPGEMALLNAVERSHFEPAQTSAGGAVTVQMVWLVTRTTVKGDATPASQAPSDVRGPKTDSASPPRTAPPRRSATV